MQMTYDSEVDVAYIAVKKSILPGEATQQVSLIDTPNGESQVTMDFDSQGYLLGLEILGASLMLTSETLSMADPS